MNTPLDSPCLICGQLRSTHQVFPSQDKDNPLYICPKPPHKGSSFVGEDCFEQLTGPLGEEELSQQVEAALRYASRCLEH